MFDPPPCLHEGVVVVNHGLAAVQQLLGAEDGHEDVAAGRVLGDPRDPLLARAHAEGDLRHDWAWGHWVLGVTISHARCIVG